MNPNAFLGSGWKFPIQVDPKTGKIALSYYEEDIQQSIEIILKTYRGERVMRPDFGCNTADYLFESSAYLAAFALVDELKQLIHLPEPRIGCL